MVAGKSRCGEFRSVGAGRVVIRSYRLAAIMATLALAACTQTVMVNPANQEAPPPSPRSSSSKAPTHEVQAGDTLYKISMQYGVDYRDLAAWNQIDAPYTIYPRQRLRVGTEPANNTVVASSRPAATTAPVASAPVAVPPSVSAGSTVASASAATPAASAATGPQAEGYNAELGVTLPAGAVPIASSTPASSAPVFEPTTPATSSTASAAAPVAASMPAAEAPLPEVSPSSPATGPSAAAPPAAASTSAGSDVAAAKPSAAGWIWPTPGKVVVTYATGDPMRQGIDIVGDFGQPVRAARDGEVVYSGAGLIGYGELVIIKHSPELLSAYGHNRVRLVKEGDKIKAGQKIAEMGKNSANRVLLHFEVRKGGKPVDPLPLLPAR